MSAGVTADEMFESLTGFEEIAISKQFGEVSTLAEGQPTMFMRALVFAALTREGQTAKDAKQQSMEMALRDVNDFFEEDPEDVDPEDPDSESGKDEPLPETPPRNLQPSAS